MCNVVLADSVRVSSTSLCVIFLMLQIHGLLSTHFLKHYFMCVQLSQSCDEQNGRECDETTGKSCSMLTSPWNTAFKTTASSSHAFLYLNLDCRMHQPRSNRMRMARELKAIKGSETDQLKEIRRRIGENNRSHILKWPGGHKWSDQPGTIASAWGLESASIFQLERCNLWDNVY